MRESRMFSRSVALSFLSLLNVLRHVSGCDDPVICAVRPFFNTSRLIVEHGHSTAATCFPCQSCENETLMLEIPLGEKVENGSTTLWVVNNMTEWETSALCYFTTFDNRQCCSRLPVIVYKPPGDVFLSLNPSGPMRDGHRYSLQCDVQDVAPVRNLTVTFFKGQTRLGQRQFVADKTWRPTNETATWDITPSVQDDGAQYWCEAKLELGPEGPPHPPLVTSQKLNGTVHYLLRQQGPPHPDPVVVTQGTSLELSCAALGNPRPSYNWSAPPSADPPSNSSTLNIASVGFEHEGPYVCSVSNEVGTFTVHFNVVVKANIMPYIIAACAGVAVLAIIGGVYWYSQNRKGKYNLLDRLRLYQPNVASG